MIEFDPTLYANTEAGVQTNPANLKRMYETAKDFLHKAKAPALAGLLGISATAACVDAQPGGEVYESCTVIVPSGARKRQSPEGAVKDPNYYKVVKKETVVENPILNVGSDGHQRVPAVFLPDGNGWVVISTHSGAVIDCGTFDVRVDPVTGKLIRIPISDNQPYPNRP